MSLYVGGSGSASPTTTTALTRPSTVDSRQAWTSPDGSRMESYGTAADLAVEPHGLPSDPVRSAAVTGAQADASRQATGVRTSTNELFKAMHGGFGMGTDEEAIHRALQGKTPDEIEAIRRQYQDHYGSSLDEDLKSELGGQDLKRAEAALKGDRTAADADALFQAMDGAGTDEEAVLRTLEGKTPEQRQALEKAYEQRHGRSLREDLKDDMGGDGLRRASALLDGDGARAEAARLHEALAGAGTDEGAVHGTLQGKTPEEREALRKAYKEAYGRDLGADLADDMSGAELDRAQAHLDGRSADAEAARLRQAMEGAGTDEKEVQSTFEGRSAEERQAIADAYRKQTGQDLRSAMSEEMGGKDLKRSEALLDRGKLSDAETLHYAVDGAGTDEAAIRSTLAGKSKDQIAAIRLDYQQRYGRDLDADLRGDLAGRDEFEATQTLKGRPESAEEALQRMNETRNFERKGLLNFYSRQAMDSLTDHGERLDANTARANEFYKSAMADGSLDTAEKARLSQLVGYSADDVGSYREAKDSVGEGVATVGATAASVAVVVGTAGTATPLVAAAAVTVTGAAARTGLKAAIQGQGYGWEEGLTDAAIGGAEGLATFVGAKAGTAAARGALLAESRVVLERAGVETSERVVEMMGKELLERSALRRAAVGFVEGAVDGGLGGALGGGVGETVRDGTWDDGVGEGLARVGASTVTGAGVGAVTGGVTSAGMSAVRGADHLIDDGKIYVDKSMPNNTWRDYGEYEEMLAVNRAVEPNPPRVQVRADDGTVREVAVYGARSPEEIKNIRNAVQRMQDLGLDEAVESTKEVHLRGTVGEMLDPVTGKRVSGLGGLGGADDGTIVVARDQAKSAYAAEHIVHHEAGHNLDAARGWVSDLDGAPFGKGASVSSYAAKNAAEDFAETHRALIENFEQITGNPDAFIHANGDIGKKYQFLLEGVYGRQVAPPSPQLAAILEGRATGGMMGSMGGMGGGMGGGMMGGMGGMGGGMMGNVDWSKFDFSNPANLGTMGAAMKAQVEASGGNWADFAEKLREQAMSGGLGGTKG